MKPSAYRLLRQAWLLGAYAAGLALALLLAFQLRFDFQVAPEYLTHIGWMLVGLVGTKMLLLAILGQFGSRLSFFGLYDLGKILTVCAIAAIMALGVWMLTGVRFAPPRAVILTDFLLSFLYLCGFRLSLRLLREGFFTRRPDTTRRRVIIIGATDAGATLAKELQARRGLGMEPIAFFDDDPRQWGTSIHGVPVQGASREITDFLLRHKVEKAIIAMPGNGGRRIREVVQQLNALHLPFEIIPSVEQLVTGQVRASQIRPVEIQDLLGRPPTNLSNDKIRGLIHARTVMVTGGGGSIGSELCRQIAAHGPRELLIVERSEFLLFQVEQELRQLGFGSEIIPLVADVLDPIRMRGIFERYRPRILFHAAAHKHVPLMEHQPAEAFRNNSIGSRDLAELSVAYGVEKFVLISTDKAINPTNVMGATKRIAELYLQALQAHTETTQFRAVRFGNVLGSSGSVIPTFKRQIASGGPITVTHPDITRYFMTVNEAVGLVLQSATLGGGGDIFVLDMGQPIKILDVARQLIELSGLQPDTDIEIKFTGLRPGEKLFEELNHNTENHAPTPHPGIMQFLSQPADLDKLRQDLTNLLAQCPSLDAASVKLAIKRIVPEYQPYLEPS